MRRKFFLAISLIALLISACSASRSPQGRGIRIEAPWARPAAQGENGAVYFTLLNDGEEDILLSAQTDVAETVELHMTTMHGGHTMQMQMQHEIQIPKGKTEFAPGGYHVMLLGLKRELKVGDSFPLTLRFQKAGELLVTVSVKE
ncbi:MAG: copper chaperone PCu(A)C [Anaerolineales bacterium]